MDEKTAVEIQIALRKEELKYLDKLMIIKKAELVGLEDWYAEQRPKQDDSH